MPHYTHTEYTVEDNVTFTPAKTLLTNAQRQPAQL